MRCPHCATRLADDSWACSGCGFPVRPKHHVVHLDFWGSPLQVLGWMVLFALVGIKISLPPAINVRIVSLNFGMPWNQHTLSFWEILAWIAFVVSALAGVWLFEAACRWFCRALRFSDDSRADFSGRGGEILGWWVLWMLAGRRWEAGLPENVALEFALNFLSLWSTLNVLRWFVAHVEFSDGRRLAFFGGYFELLGWTLLLALSVITVVGWAWVLAAIYRWMARNTRSELAALRFHAVGAQILWRTLAMVLFSIPVITIPWSWLWYTRWLVRSTTIEGQLAEA